MLVDTGIVLKVKGNGVDLVSAEQTLPVREGLVVTGISLSGVGARIVQVGAAVSIKPCHIAGKAARRAQIDIVEIAADSAQFDAERARCRAAEQIVENRAHAGDGAESGR